MPQDPLSPLSSRPQSSHRRAAPPVSSRPLVPPCPYPPIARPLCALDLRPAPHYPPPMRKSLLTGWRFERVETRSFRRKTEPNGTGSRLATARPFLLSIGSSRGDVTAPAQCYVCFSRLPEQGRTGATLVYPAEPAGRACLSFPTSTSRSRAQPLQQPQRKSTKWSLVNECLRYISESARCP